MGCFVGIQIPPELGRKLLSFRQERGYITMEPHIKVISPALLENTPVAHQKLESFCLSQPEFQVTLTAPVGIGNVFLYFPVAGDGVANMRSHLLDHFKVQPTIINFRPHLTIMRQTGGLDLHRYLEEAKETFSTPYTFTVAEATLYTSYDNKTFVPERQIPFTGK